MIGSRKRWSVCDGLASDWTVAKPRDRNSVVRFGWRRRSLLESHLQEQLGQVLRSDPSRIDRDIPLTKLGLDSLMALELRNRLESSLGLSLSATLIWAHPTIAALASHLAQKMEIPLEPQPETKNEADVIAVAALSADETRTLLAAELDDLPEELLRGD